MGKRFFEGALTITLESYVGKDRRIRIDNNYTKLWSERVRIQLRSTPSDLFQP